MHIEFYLLGDEDAKGNVRIREYFAFVSEAERIDVNGNRVPVVNQRGLVDDDIRREHAAEYGKFLAAVNEHRELAEELARNVPGELIHVSDFLPVSPVSPVDPVEVESEESTHKEEEDEA